MQTLREDTPPRILIVEDDVLVAQDIQESVERLGYNVASVVHSGEDAVLAAGSVGIDLALMDIRLPGKMDGTEAAWIIGERDRIPIVYLTAYTDDRTLERAGNTNPSGYVIKPFNERDLRSAIEIALHRSRMQAALNAVQERYRRIFESAVVGHVVLTPDGWMLDCNPAFLQIFGFDSMEEAKAEYLFRLFRNPEDEGRILSILRLKGRLDRQEIELSSKDGRPLTVLADAVGSFDESGELIEIHGHCIDITEERRLQRQLARAGKREALGRMAGATCHQFNNVLSLAQEQTERILALPSLPPEIREATWAIRHALRRGERLTRELLHTAGTDIGDRQLVDPNHLLREIVPQLPSIAEKGVLVRLDLRMRGLIEADPERLERAIIDLIENGLEAMGMAGTLSLRTYAREVTEPIRGEGDDIAPGSYAVVEVEDTGEGVHPMHREKIFDPYFSTRSGRYGLGLTRALGSLRWHNAGIEFSSVPGEGTTVRLFFPLAGSSDAKAPPRMKVDTEAFSGTETILVVDDNHAILDVATRLLSRFGYAVLGADHGQEALDILQEHSHAIDLVITDIVMPGMDGKELIARLRAQGITVPVLVLSSQVGAGDLLMGRLPPDVALLSKPFVPGELLGEVRKLLDHPPEI